MLVGVHPLVGELDGVIEVVGLVRQQHHAVGRGDGELLSGLAERGRGDRDDLFDVFGVDLEHGAELVAAEPVGLAVRRELVAELGPEAREKRVACDVAEGVVVALEAVEVEHDQQARARRRRSVSQRLDVGRQLAPVAEAGQRVADRFLAQRVVAEDVGRGGLRLADELAEQLDLVVWNGRVAPSDADRAAGRGRPVDGERQRERPSGLVLDLLRQAGRRRRVVSRRAARRRTRPPSPRAGVGARPSRTEASGVGVERFDRAAQHDVDERVDVELGRECVAHAAHRSLQAAALAYRELESVLGLLDALAPIAGHQQQQPGQRQDEQDREDVALRDLGGEEADRRQTGVDDPNQPEDVQLERGRDALATRARAGWRDAGVEEAAGHERGREHAAARPGRAAAAPASEQHAGRPDARARRRESRTAGARTSRAARIQSDSRAQQEPGGHEQRHRAGGTSTSIGISTSCVGSTLPAPTGNSTLARIA